MQTYRNEEHDHDGRNEMRVNVDYGQPTIS